MTLSTIFKRKDYHVFNIAFSFLYHCSSVFCRNTQKHSSRHTHTHETAQTGSPLEVVDYKNEYKQGIINILSQKTSEGRSHEALVVSIERIIPALQDPKYKGVVLLDKAKNVVAGFAVCSISNNKRYYAQDKTSLWWYVDWLALDKNYQGKGRTPEGASSTASSSTASTPRSIATLLWNRIIEDAKKEGLPIMLNTLTTNINMQNWCKSKGMTDEGNIPPLKYYTYQKHLTGELAHLKIDLDPYRAAESAPATVSASTVSPTPTTTVTSTPARPTPQAQSFFARMRQNLSQFWASPKNYLQSWYNRYRTPLLGGTTILVGSGLAAWFAKNYNRTPTLQPQLATKN